MMPGNGLFAVSVSLSILVLVSLLVGIELDDFVLVPANGLILVR